MPDTAVTFPFRSLISWFSTRMLFVGPGIQITHGLLYALGRTVDAVDALREPLMVSPARFSHARIDATASWGLRREGCCPS